MTRHKQSLLLGLSCFCLLAFTTNVRAELKAGAAKKSIVPPFPTHMGGFMDRTQTFTGVHDEVYARALVLDNGETKLVLIGSDLTAVSAELTASIRAEIEKATGIPQSHIMVSCAHNHSAPSLYEPGRLKKSESPVMEYFVKQFSAAAVEAFNNRQPAQLGFQAGELRGATRNRQQDNDNIDPQVGVVLVQKQNSREVIATLFNFTGHPVIIGSSNLELSGEYPGVAERTVENLLGGVAIFTQGAAGDITVNRSGDPFEEIERLGRTLAGEVIKTAGFVTGRENIELAVRSKTLDLPARVVPPKETTMAEMKKLQDDLQTAEEQNMSMAYRKRLQKKLQIHEINLFVSTQKENGTMETPERFEAEVQVMQIGDLVLVAIPGEIFVEYALELRSRIKQTFDKSMCLIGYANGYIGYIVTPRASNTGGYEASVARVQPDSGRQMTETSMELVHEIKPTE